MGGTLSCRHVHNPHSSHRKGSGQRLSITSAKEYGDFSLVNFVCDSLTASNDNPASSSRASSRSSLYRQQCSTTPLIQAAGSGNLNLVKAILEYNPHGPGFREKTSRPSSPTAKSKRSSSASSAASSSSRCLVNHSDEFGLTPLMHSIISTHLQVFNFLINHPDIDIHQQDEMGRQALTFCALKGHVGMVKALVRLGANIHQADSFGMTGLMYSASAGYGRVVQDFISMGADLTVENQRGFNALMLAAQNGHLNVIDILVAARCDVNTKSRLGNTALSVAVKTGNLRVVQALLEHGAACSIVVQGGHTAMSLAVESEHRQVVQLLQLYGATSSMGKVSSRSSKSIASSYLSTCADSDMETIASAPSLVSLTLSPCMSEEFP